MYKHLKRSVAALLAVGLVGTMAACGGQAGTNTGASKDSAKADTKSAQPFAGKKITVFALNHPWSDTIKASLKEFEASSGMKVDFQLIGEDQLSQKLAVQIASGAVDPDVFMYRPYMDKILYHKNGWTTPLNDYVNKDPKYDFADFAKSSIDASTIDNKITSIPVYTDQFVLYYRKDILEKNGIAVPKTMVELEAAAKKLHDPGKEFYGFVGRGQRNALVTAVSSFVFSEGGDFMKDGKAAINTPEAIKGFQLYADLIKNYGPQGVLNMSWPQAAGIFAQGKAAFYTETASVYKNTTDPEKSLVKDKIGFAQLPAGSAGTKPYSIAAWALAINSKSVNKDASWEFMQWATNKEMVLKTQRSGVPGPRNSVWSQKEGVETFPPDLAAAIQETMKIGVGHNVPEVISVGEARDAVGSVVVKAVLGEDIKAAADKANAEFQAIIDKDKTK
ncbi:ABC transporter substrate-binding protein [Paenibacillus radicis (ex Xue et al. 2023)]|uniref:Sugar ABC transporter substrate-binding protein n=1 Tax=Paenibacillus radicis (ex Xue et al. 2023) TaxID=2972489 RepID=A0ABT1YR04_9BACL|nr:sugar ABC transporter substrate-binding protein [Paenibacillus radicis (ex Xue et al. 2023)]MCR8635619.1 sugar ABC transporter substrate-binding protein [Paenibacillus radicis (ex Xue et al. 2023)]